MQQVWVILAGAGYFVAVASTRAKAAEMAVKLVERGILRNGRYVVRAANLDREPN